MGKIKIFPLSNQKEVEIKYKILKWASYGNVWYGTDNKYDIFIQPDRDIFVFRFWLIPDKAWNEFSKDAECNKVFDYEKLKGGK